MARTVAVLFDTYDEAAEAVAALEDAGTLCADISIVSNRIEKHYEGDDKATGTVAADGAKLGSLAGASAGLLASLGIIAIPGIGPVLAAGWLTATALGATTGAIAGGIAGGIIGSLTRAGIRDADANVYAEGVRRGGTLVTVRCDESRASIVEDVLHSYDTVDIDARANLFRDNGWRQFDEAGRAESAEELARARQDPRMPVL